MTRWGKPLTQVKCDGGEATGWGGGKSEGLPEAGARTMGHGGGGLLPRGGGGRGPKSHSESRGIGHHPLV